MDRTEPNGNRIKRSVRNLCAVLFLAVLGEGIAAGLTVLLLKRLDAVLLFLGSRIAPDEPIVETLSRVFSALRTASVRPRILLPLLPALAASAVLLCGTGFLPGHGRKPGGIRTALSLLLGLLLWLLFSLAAFALTLWLADVNGIRFGDMVLSLLRTVRSGALDSL